MISNLLNADSCEGVLLWPPEGLVLEGMRDMPSCMDVQGLTLQSSSRGVHKDSDWLICTGHFSSTTDYTGRMMLQHCSGKRMSPHEEEIAHVVMVISGTHDKGLPSSPAPLPPQIQCSTPFTSCLAMVCQAELAGCRQ